MTSHKPLALALAAMAVAGVADADAAARRPDLKVTKLSRTAPLAPRSAVDVRATVAVAGRRAPKSVARLVLSRDARRDRSDVLLARAAVRKLAAGKKANVRLRGVVPAATRAGSYRLLVCADDLKKVREAREANNCRSTSVSVKAAIPASAPSTRPATPGVQVQQDAFGKIDEVSSSCAAVADLPDLTFADTNCDGIDGDAARSVFVSSAGDDAAAGTKDAPKRTLKAGIAAAQAQGLDAVLVSAGQFPGGVEIKDGVSLYGGYDPATWQRGGKAQTVVTSEQTGGGSRAAHAEDIGTPTTIQRISLLANPGGWQGDSAYGLMAEQASRLRLEGVFISAGQGRNGTAGLPGNTGVQGANGSDGGDGSCDDKSANGKGGSGAGSEAGDGGDGGMGLQWDGKDGEISGTGKKGGKGGESGDPGEDGGKGDDGFDGQSGLNGDGGSGGYFLSGWWIPSAGEDGDQGDTGQSGAGGGGSGGQTGLKWWQGGGNGGGGGASGGIGGQGGKGGWGGGGSFGVFALDSHGLQIVDSTIIAANGGNGGTGALGGGGGKGGTGGKGGDACVDEVGTGGAGGNGGKGGTGGQGGGGAGGPSYALFGKGGKLAVSGTTLTFGKGGKPGAPATPAGHWGNYGNAGERGGV